MRHKYTIDNRDKSDILKNIKTLSNSYTKEWNFDTENPDVGSVIAMIFANQVEDNINRTNRMIDKYHTEFINILNISALPATPSKSVVSMELTSDTIDGTYLRKGTKFLGKASEDEEPIVFETVGDVYITKSRLNSIISVSDSSIKANLGNIKPCAIFDEIYEENLNDKQTSFHLFSKEEDGFYKNALILYYKSVFDINEDIFVCFKSNDINFSLDDLCDKSQYKWYYYGQSGKTDFQSVFVLDDKIVLKKSEDAKKIFYKDSEYYAICLEKINTPKVPIFVEDIKISSYGKNIIPTFVNHNTEDLYVNKFMPFSNTASLFEECFIGCDSAFGEQGATVTIRFNLSFNEKLITFSKEKEEEELKVIKRKSKKILFETSESVVNKVSFEYYNGIGFKKLQLATDMSTIFNGDFKGDIILSFICPDDFQPFTVGGYEEKVIRIRVLQADNCYLQPCLHKMPIISNFRIDYSYLDKYKTPQKIRIVKATNEKEITFKSGESICIFEQFKYTNNSVFLGFDSKMEGAPISIFFDIVENLYSENANIVFYYSTNRGFEQIKVINQTNNFRNSGTIMFVPPSDFSEIEVEGIKGYFLKIEDVDNFYDNARYKPLIKDIKINALDVFNVETLDTDEFYIDLVRPNMTFYLPADNILYADIFVNEKMTLSQSIMKQMLLDNPDDVWIEYDFLGEISEFFVRWTEVNSFANSKPNDRHYIINRMDNTLIFSDGNTCKIPKVTDGVAFTVKIRRCSGAIGNVKKDNINQSFDNLLYIDNIQNIIPAYGGCNIESFDNLHKRASSIINSGDRLVSEDDFLREIKSFSNDIIKCKIILGKDILNNKIENAISIVIMLRDYSDGLYSFNTIKDRLKDRLFEKCEATIDEDKLFIYPAIYVYLSVNIWIEFNDIENFFELQNKINSHISNFLEPIDSENSFQIGRFPTEEQIKLCILSIKEKFRLKHFCVTAKYTDKTGTHESSLDNIQNNDFIVCLNGEHKISRINKD